MSPKNYTNCKGLDVVKRTQFMALERQTRKRKSTEARPLVLGRSKVRPSTPAANLRSLERDSLTDAMFRRHGFSRNRRCGNKLQSTPGEYTLTNNLANFATPVNVGKSVIKHGTCLPVPCRVTKSRRFPFSEI